MNKILATPLSTKIWIIQFLRPKTCNLVLDAAHKQGQVHLEQSHIMFCPDLSPQIAQQRFTFQKARALTRDLGLKYYMRYPANTGSTPQGTKSFMISESAEF